MTGPIEAIFFDVNGTLRGSVPAPEGRKREKLSELLKLVGAQTTIDDFFELLTARMQAYRSRARAGSKELSEADLWTNWMLPDYPPEHIRKTALQLNQLWREATRVRAMFPDAREVLLELFRRGYRLGIVSNTLSTLELPSALRKLEISGLFETVVLSCQVGVRKPDPAILIEAAGRLPVEPGRCAYVGNRPERDLVAARGARFSRAILIRNSDAAAAPVSDNASLTADHYIDNLRQLLDIFPPLDHSPAAQPVYDASFSTMWARHNFPRLLDFFAASSRLGFARVELNHQIDSSMLQGIDLSKCSISSIHEPCPADITTERLKERDWLISSTDEQCRQRGVEAIRRSIELAHQLRVPVIVIHAGMVSTDMVLESQLRKLFQAGQSTTDEYLAVKEALIESRRCQAGAHLEAVRKSLPELLDYAARFGIRLGLENRYHFFDIPGLDEMAELLALADASRLGFVYDVGHAQALHQLGFYPHEDWLRRYAYRIIEVHLHDVKGVNDHLAPGMGDVDFNMVASYLPEAAIRTLELQPSNTPEQVRAALRFLAAHGCIKTIQ